MMLLIGIGDNMKPYGYKKNKKPKGDGCFLCTQERKQTKTSTRRKAKKEIKDDKNSSD